MAVINTPYAHTLKILCGAGDWLANDVKLALLDSDYVFNAAHTEFDNGEEDATDPSYHELADGDGYTAGGELLDTSIENNKLIADPFDFLFTEATVFRQGVVYIDGTVDTVAKPLLFHILFDDTDGGTDVSWPADVDFPVIWSDDGVSGLTVAQG
jgi:hypothetical protein